jgi:hypothetical protein
MTPFLANNTDSMSRHCLLNDAQYLRRRLPWCGRALWTATILLLTNSLGGRSAVVVNAYVPAGAKAATEKATTAEMECMADGTCKEAPSVGTDGSKVLSEADLQCTVYMAPSTLGVDTSMGIYTAIPLEEGVTVNFPEIAVPLLFREFGDHVEGYDDGVLWDRYVWEGEVMEVETYIDTNRHASRAVFVPGVGCTVNSVLDMNNIHSTHGSNYSTAGLHRSRDPGSGAFAPYYNSPTVTAEAVPAGGE